MLLRKRPPLREAAGAFEKQNLWRPSGLLDQGIDRSMGNLVGSRTDRQQRLIASSRRCFGRSKSDGHRGGLAGAEGEGSRAYKISQSGINRAAHGQRECRLTGANVFEPDGGGFGLA